MTLDDIVARFARPKRAGRGYLVQCAGHEDRQQSLSIGPGDTGVVMKCFAGCDTEAVLAAVGLELKDLYDDHRPAAVPVTARYDYRALDGALLYQVERRADKSFRQRRPDGRGGWIYNLNGTPRVLYRWPDVRDVPAVWIPEGERDVDTLHAVGLPAVCNSGGAGKWRPEHTQQLLQAGCRRVVVLPDADPAGQAHADLVARTCHEAGLRVKVVPLPVPPKGDVTDYLRDHTRADLFALATAAPIWTPAATSADPVPVSPEPETEAPHLIQLSTVLPEAVEYLWPHRLARGKKTLIAGDPGGGKTMLTIDIAARLTTGAAWPDGGTAPIGNVLFLCAEDGLADTVRPRLDAAGGDPSRVYVLDGVRETTGGIRMVTLARDLALLEAAIHEVSPLLVIIDPITAYLGRTDSYKDSEVRGLLAPLLAALDRHRCALLSVAHLSKDAQRAALHRPGGSIAFVAAARLVFAVAADPNDEDRRILAPLKSNICAKAPSLAFRLPDGRIQWDREPVTLDAEALLRPSSPQDRDEQADANTFLADLLANSPLRSAVVHKAAEANGISRRQLFRAKAHLKVRATREGGLGEDGYWTWALTVSPNHTGPTSDTDSTLSDLRPLSVSTLSKSINSLEGTVRTDDDDFSV